MKKIIAKYLLEISAVFLRPSQPFIWSSGIKSPIYCDNRLILSYPKVRDIVEEALAKTVEEYFPECEYIMGTATAGIAHAALVAKILDLPTGYVRSSSKSHGRENKIEGKLIKNAKVVVIEDLISTGGSSISVVQTLRESGFDVLGVVSIFDYNLEKAKNQFNENNIKYRSISDYNTLIEVALTMNYIEDKDLMKLKQWKLDPNDESWISK